MKTCRLILVKDLTYTTGDINNPIERKILKGESVLCSQESVSEGGEIFILSSGWGKIERDYFFEPVRSDEQREKDALRIQVRLIAAGMMRHIPEDGLVLTGYGIEFAKIIKEIFGIFECLKSFHNINHATDYLYLHGIRAITE